MLSNYGVHESTGIITFSSLLTKLRAFLIYFCPRPRLMVTKKNPHRLLNKQSVTPENKKQLTNAYNNDKSEEIKITKEKLLNIKGRVLNDIHSGDQTLIPFSH